MRVQEPSKAAVIVYALASKAGSLLVIPRYLTEIDSFSDPMGQAEFRKIDGRNPKIQTWIQKDAKVKALVESYVGLVKDHITHNKEFFVSLAIRDYHGRWRSAAVAELVADAIDEAGFDVFVSHRWEK